MRKSLKVLSFCSFSYHFDGCEYKKTEKFKDRMSSKVPTFEFRFLSALTNLKKHIFTKDGHVGTLSLCLETLESMERI